MGGGGGGGGCVGRREKRKEKAGLYWDKMYIHFIYDYYLISEGYITMWDVKKFLESPDAEDAVSINIFFSFVFYSCGQCFTLQCY